MSRGLIEAVRTQRARFAVLPGCLLGAVILWSYAPTLATLAARWTHDPRYSHGVIVPIFAAYLLWDRWPMLVPTAEGGGWWGAAWLAAGAVIRLFGAIVFLEWVDAVSLLPTLIGLFVFVAGRSAVRWSWPAVAFLVFMIPLPYHVEWALGEPLQRLATLASTYALQTFGLPAVALGNIIQIDDTRIGVVEACNGLGMLYMFAAFAVAAVLVVRRPMLDRVLVLLSAIPIAVLANIVRITVTGLLHATAGGKVADIVYHDLAGWLMMPLALGLFWLELRLLAALFLEPPTVDVTPASLRGQLPGIGPRPAGSIHGR